MISSFVEFVVPIMISITCNKPKNNKIFSCSASVVCRLLLLHYCGTAGVAFDLIKNRSYLPHFVAGLMLTSTLCCCSGQRAPSTQVGIPGDFGGRWLFRLVDYNVNSKPLVHRPCNPAALCDTCMCLPWQGQLMASDNEILLLMV